MGEKISMTPNKTSEVGSRRDMGMLSPRQTLQICDSEHSDGTRDENKTPLVGFVMHFVVILNICQIAFPPPPDRTPVTSH